jgi:fatty acid desaturase
MIFPKAFLDNLKNQLPQNETIIQFFRNYLADGLWCFSLIMGLSLIFPKHYIISSVFGFSFGVLFEILQLIGAVKGTFSIGDIITYAVTALVAVIILKHSSNALKTKIKEKQK